MEGFFRILLFTYAAVLSRWNPDFSKYRGKRKFIWKIEGKRLLVWVTGRFEKIEGSKYQSTITLKFHCIWDPFNTTPKEFENGGFTLKTHHMFSVHTTPEEFTNATMTSHFGSVCFWTTLSGKSPDCRDAIVFEKLRFQNVFRPQKNEKPTFSNSCGLKSVFVTD